jgi:hypothetical protein
MMSNIDPPLGKERLNGYIMAPLGAALSFPHSPLSKKKKYVPGLIIYKRTGDRESMRGT